MPEPKPINPPLVREMSAKRVGREISEADAAAVAGLLNGLEADMLAFRKLKIADGEEPATTYAAIEGEP